MIEVQRVAWFPETGPRKIAADRQHMGTCKVYQFGGLKWAHRVARSVLVGCATLLLTMGVDGLELSPERFPITVDGMTMELPYSCSQPIDQPDMRINRIIVAVHGRGPEAPAYLKRILEAGKQAPSQSRRTLVIAPQLLDDGNHTEMTLDDNDIYWTSGVSFWGGLSTGKQARRVSSFEILDQLLASVSNRTLFPRLERIVIIGHSAGGQFVNRYAASSPFEDKVASPAGISLRYIVCNPSTCVYFTPERVVPGTTTQFAVPDFSDCENYNHYGYGPEKLYSYHRENGGALLRDSYASRNVIYMVGAEDNDSRDSSLSNSCRAKMQGRTRLQRATIYFNYLKHVFGAEIAERQTLVVVPGVGHSSRQIFKSKQGVAYLFDYPGDPMENRRFRENLE